MVTLIDFPKGGPFLLYSYKTITRHHYLSLLKSLQCKDCFKCLKLSRNNVLCSGGKDLLHNQHIAVMFFIFSTFTRDHLNGAF